MIATEAQIHQCISLYINPLKPRRARKSQFYTYPSEFIEFLDRAIHTVLNPKKSR